MGSLITALQNQNIAAANQETLGDIYAANPTNLGYTDNPFEYTSSPAVIQTAYPEYGYNATAPMMPPSYEEYDLTSLFGMLEKMKNPQPSLGDPGPVIDGGPLDERPLRPNWLREDENFGGITLYQQPPQPGKPLVAPAPGYQLPLPTMPTQPVTPAGILAQLAGEVQQQTGQTTPVPGAYTVPGTEPVTPETEEEDAQAASDERIRKLIAENAAKQQRSELEQRYKKTTGLPVISKASNWDLRQVLDDPSSPYNVTE
jgi:hypothetical protein